MTPETTPQPDELRSAQPSKFLTLEETFSTFARLQQAEERATAAEMALDRLKTYATDTFILWDKDQDSKVGKRLLWMSGAGNEGYEPDLNWIHKPVITAARELMRKAEERDKFRDKLGDIEGYLASAADLANSWARESRVEQAANEMGLNGVIDRLWTHWTLEADTLRKQNEELAALVERIFAAWKIYQDDANSNGVLPVIDAIRKAYRLTPSAALTDLKAGVRRETLKEVAKLADEWVVGPGNLALELRRMAGEES